jgi:hypothetical protein
MGIFDIFKSGKEFARDFDNIFNKFLHDGKEYFGEVLIQDNAGYLWKIRVRWTGDRGRYLKLDSQSNSSQQIRVTADGYKDYLRVRLVLSK